MHKYTMSYTLRTGVTIEEARYASSISSAMRIAADELSTIGVTRVVISREAPLRKRQAQAALSAMREKMGIGIADVHNVGRETVRRIESQEDVVSNIMIARYAKSLGLDVETVNNLRCKKA